MQIYFFPSYSAAIFFISFYSVCHFLGNFATVLETDLFYRFMNSNSITLTKKRARIALLIQFFLCGFIYSTLLSRFPALLENYNMNMTQMSGVLLSMSIGSFCTMPLNVHLMGKFGSKKTTIAGFFYMILLPLLALMPNIISLYIIGLLYGVFISMLDVAMNGNTILVENAYKRPIISLFHAAYYVGVCMSAIASVFFIKHAISVQIHYSIIAVISIIVFFFIRQWYLQETITEDYIPSHKKIIFPKGILLFLAFIALCGRVVEGSVNNWSTIYMKTIVEFPEYLAPLGLAIYSAFMSIGRFFCDSIRARYQESSILLVCCGITAIGVLLIISNTAYYFAFTGLFIAGLGISCLVPIIYSLAGRQKDVTPAMGIAMVNTISGTGFLFGPFIIGLIADHYNMRASFLYIWCLTLIMCLLTYFYRKKEHRLK